jgi:hypothetical protein
VAQSELLRFVVALGIVSGLKCLPHSRNAGSRAILVGRGRRRHRNRERNKKQAQVRCSSHYPA